MKDFFLLSAVCVLVVGVVSWVLLPGSTDDLFRTRVVVQPQESDIPSPPPPPRPAPAPPHTNRKPLVAAPERGPDVAVAAPVAPIVEVKPAVAPATPSANLPLPWEVVPGEQGTAIVDAYGAPELTTSTQDAGHIFETYIYRSSGKQSIIHLEDGKVSRVLLKGSPN